jgi:hypothetical protein
VAGALSEGGSVQSAGRVIVVAARAGGVGLTE